MRATTDEETHAGESRRIHREQPKGAGGEETQETSRAIGKPEEGSLERGLSFRMTAWEPDESLVTESLKSDQEGRRVKEVGSSTQVGKQASGARDRKVA